MAYVLQQFIKILHDRVHEAPPSRLVMHDMSMDPLHLPRSPHVQQTSRVGTPWTARQLSSNHHGHNHSGGAPATNARAAALEKSHVTTIG